MSLIEDREPFAAKYARIAAKIDREMAEMLGGKGRLDRDWGRETKKPQAKSPLPKPRPKRVRGENPNWERW